MEYLLRLKLELLRLKLELHQLSHEAPFLQQS